MTSPPSTTAQEDTEGATLRRRLPSLALVLTLVTSVLLVGSGPAEAAHEITAARAGGDDRYETAATLARLEFPEGSGAAVLATGETYPDALAGAALTGASDAPLLLVRQDAIPEVTSSALEELGVSNVYLLGGEQAISREVEAELEEDYELARLAGTTRYGTAAAVAAEVDRREDELGRIAGLTTAFVASGEAFPDALAAGSLATTQSDAFPILLVRPDAYPAETEQALADLGIEQAIIVGGTEAVDEHVERHLEEDLTAVLRLGGDDRTATAVELADFAMREFDYNGELTVLTRSDDFPDALATGLHAGRNDAAILLTPPDDLADPTHDWLHDVCPTIGVVRAIGGTDALHVATLDDAVEHAEHCHSSEGQTGETYIVEPTRPVTVGAGATVDLHVRERHDRRPLQEPLDVTLFPCGNVDRATDRFTDADGDGFADGIATSTNGDVRIESATEASRIDPGYAHNARFLHGDLSWTLASDAEDCTVTIVFGDIDGDNQLPVDGEGRPLEHYGARQVTWTAS